MNLWDRSQDHFPAQYDAIQDAFDGNTLKLLLSDACWNALAFGFRYPPRVRTARLPAAGQKAAGRLQSQFPQVPQAPVLVELRLRENFDEGAGIGASGGPEAPFRSAYRSLS